MAPVRDPAQDTERCMDDDVDRRPAPQRRPQRRSQGRRPRSSRTRRRGPRRRRHRAVRAAPAARAGPAGARLRQRLRRGRDLVLEPLPGVAVRRRRATSTSTCSPRSSTRTGAGARELPGQPRDRALATLRRRPPRSPAPNIQFSTTVTAAHFDEERGRWTLRTDRGDVTRHPVLRHLRRAALRADGEPLPGPGQLRGEQIFHTSRWPKEPVELAEKRVGVVGVGATGIQVIQTIAREVEHL